MGRTKAKRSEIKVYKLTSSDFVDKYGEKLPYETKRAAIFDNEICPPKNGKYEIEMDTNFGTYYYEARAVIGESFL